MAQLKVTAKKLRDTQGTLNSQNSKLKGQIDSLRTIEARLNKMWDGPANDEFHKVFTKDIAQFENFRALIAEYSKTLGDAADKYDETERRNMELAKNR